MQSITYDAALKHLTFVCMPTMGINQTNRVSLFISAISLIVSLNFAFWANTQYMIGERNKHYGSTRTSLLSPQIEHLDNDLSIWVTKCKQHKRQNKIKDRSVMSLQPFDKSFKELEYQEAVYLQKIFPVFYFQIFQNFLFLRKLVKNGKTCFKEHT